MNTVSSVGEFGVISRIRERFVTSHHEVLVGIGDDTATLAFGQKPVIFTTDTMIQNVHFRTDWSSAEQVAIKLLASNLSDLASKAAEPIAMTLNLGLPGDTPLSWLDAFLDSLADESTRSRIDLVGGDTVRSESLVLTLTAWGYQSTPGAIRVHGAIPGDSIFVTGTLGDSRAGYLILESGVETSGTSYLLQRFHAPGARVSEALAITSLVQPTAMTDVSDGLARDLPKLCEASGVGALLHAEALPIHDELVAFAGRDAASIAWQGGEDYELLFTVSPEARETLLSKWGNSSCKLTMIGCIERESGIHWDNNNLAAQSGYDHFRA